MMDAHFDRWTRLLTRAGSRRQALAVFGALAAARLRRADAEQIEVAACGEVGAVCTALAGCCEGLVCATSTVNPTYGVCVTGEGDIVAVTDDLVVPGSEGIEDELAAQVSDAAAEASDARSTLGAQGDKGAKRRTGTDVGTTGTTTTSTSAQTHRERVRARKAANRLNSSDDNKSLNRRPRLTLTLSDNAGSGLETLRVVNDGGASVLISRIESLTPPFDFKDLTITLGPGRTQTLRSDTDDWPAGEVCTEGEPGDGIVLTVTKFGAFRSHQLEALCDPLAPAESTTTARSQSEKKTEKKGRAQKRSKRGKGK
jgi:hypothetical protein